MKLIRLKQLSLNNKYLNNKTKTLNISKINN